MNKLTTIDSPNLDHVTGGGWKSKALQAGKKAATWTLDNVIKPGAAAVGFDTVWDRATGSNRGARPDQPAQGGNQTQTP